MLYPKSKIVCAESKICHLSIFFDIFSNFIIFYSMFFEFLSFSVKKSSARLAAAELFCFLRSEIVVEPFFQRVVVGIAGGGRKQLEELVKRLGITNELGLEQRGEAGK